MEILNAVIKKLASLGYAAVGVDHEVIKADIDKAEANLKALTNQFELPEGLGSTWVDMAAGYFLSDKKASGALASVYDFSPPAKAVSEGDTSVTFAIADTGSFEDQFDAMLERMTMPNEDVIARYRRLLW